MMKRVAVLLPLVLLVAGWSTGGQKEGAKDAVREIPLAEVFSTSGQKDIYRISRHRQGRYEPTLAHMWRNSSTAASNIFLVRGKDLAEAVDATSRVMTGRGGVATPPAGRHDSKATDFWTVVYFGSDGSSPPAWKVSKIERRMNTVTIKFSNPGAETDDSEQYFLWVPLGKLQPGSHRLELYDQDRKETVLMRSVRIEQPRGMDD